MSLKLNKYLLQLKKNANKLEQYDINGQFVQDKYGIPKRRIFAILSSLIITLLLQKGFSSTFVSYVSAVLSILVGLFINSLIFGMDKFYVKSSKEHINSAERVWETQSYNYYKQFLYIIGYNIVRCVFTLVILSLSALFTNVFGENFDLNCFSVQTHQIKQEHLLNFAIYIAVFFQRFSVFYLISCIIHNTLFVVSSMVAFMVNKSKNENS